MPERDLHQEEQAIAKLLKRNAIISAIMAATGFSLLVPAFSTQGTRFDYQEFCYQPRANQQRGIDGCLPEETRRGIAWKLALEVANNSEFRDNTTFSNFVPAQNPYAGLFGLCGAAFFGSAFFFLRHGTNRLEENLDLVVSNKTAVIQERSLSQNKHLNLYSLQTKQEEEFITEIMNREHSAAMYELLGDGEKELAARSHHRGEQLDEAQLSLQLATFQAQTAEQLEKEAKHRAELEKLAKKSKTKTEGTGLSTDEAAKQELIEKLKNHENGWLHTLCTTRKVLIIEGEQGSFKSFTAALIAFCRYHLCGHKLGWIVDSDYHQNKSEAWQILQKFEFDAYGANKNGEGIREGLQRFLDGIEVREERTCEIETIIFDELTTYGDYPECEGISRSFMKFVLSAPRKAAYGVIAITHSMTNEGTGKGGGMAEARKRGSLHLLLNADNDYNPTFKGVLNGFKDESGQLLEDMPVTLPDWFRPSKLASMLGGK